MKQLQFVFRYEGGYRWNIPHVDQCGDLCEGRRMIPYTYAWTMDDPWTPIKVEGTGPSECSNRSCWYHGEYQ